MPEPALYSADILLINLFLKSPSESQKPEQPVAHSDPVYLESPAKLLNEKSYIWVIVAALDSAGNARQMISASARNDFFILLNTVLSSLFINIKYSSFFYISNFFSRRPAD